MTDSRCPDEMTLRALVAGEMADRQQVDVTNHIDDCARCRKMLEAMADASGVLPQSSDGVNAKSRGNSDSLDALKELLKAQQSTTAGSEQTTADRVSLDFLSASNVSEHLGRIGDYEIMEVLGHGGTGIVFRALDPRLHRVVAIKVLHPVLAINGSARMRFLREARAAAAVSHDHVVVTHAVDDVNGLPLIVMEYVVGMTLDKRMERSGPLKIAEILRIGMQAASGLAAAHAQGLVHRDIKPANILLENGVERVKITDFGLARAADDVQITQTGVVAGTPQYMSPEQARGELVDHRSDLFSLGSVLYCMCTGRSPFRAGTLVDAIRRVCDDTPRPIREVNPEIPDWFVPIIDRLLAKHPDDRFQSADEVANLLGEHLAHLQRH